MSSMVQARWNPGITTCNGTQASGIQLGMPRRFQFIIALMIVAAITWVLISPALDELPGTTSRQILLLFVAALVPGITVALGNSQPLRPPEIDVLHRLDVLAVTCTRLC